MIEQFALRVNKVTKGVDTLPDNVIAILLAQHTYTLKQQISMHSHPENVQLDIKVENVTFNLTLDICKYKALTLENDYFYEHMFNIFHDYHVHVEFNYSKTIENNK